MSTVPVGQFLRDVSSDQGRQGPLALVDFITVPDHRGVQSDIEAKAEEAHIQGVLEGRAEAQAEYDRRIEAKVAELERAFADERAAWVKAQADALHATLMSELMRTREDISEQVARVLKPFVEERTCDKAIRELKALLDQIMFKGEFRKITVEGPEDLVTSLKDRIGEDAQGITYSVGETAALTISADETILEARISAWIDAIRGDAE